MSRLLARRQASTGMASHDNGSLELSCRSNQAKRKKEAGPNGAPPLCV